MNWYLKVLRDNYANFNGRARRKEFWMFSLFNLIIIYGSLMVLGLLAYALDSPFIIFLVYIYILATIVPSLALNVRRLHDVNKSGWFLLIALVPFIGSIWLFVLSVTEGDHGPNEYGPDPKLDNAEEINDIGKTQIEA
ncbi:DUF805 domain-containing protein [Tamlana sp. s12]|uniref:DUF805 domain-containing protein n=1 Tax=Tamlana sp. s12 TaxID=1630406 RepID=UPI0007FCE3B0|nr:DUF805 domain-containing protein [Tamlana sp. s12]OBQ54655.1 membrane protein [Tamlana sp. s12]QQY82153.1 DUF805 domain-containing protein [Tamlana sp. s12]